MYISEIKIRNFRGFDANEHVIYFGKGLNVLVGENDSGKSAVIDAIRIALGVTDQSWYRIEASDFYGEDTDRDIFISCKFSDLNDIEQAAFLECLTVKKENISLYYNWTCRYINNFTTPRLVSNVSTGEYCNGPAPSQEARELLRVTFLRPLRDAYMNMHAGKSSRLSQVLFSVKNLNDGEKTYTQGMDLNQLSITGIADLANQLLSRHDKINRVNCEISNTLSDRMLLNDDNIETSISVAGTNIPEERRLSNLLEKLELTANKSGNAGKVGLGTSNLISMACELQLNRSEISSFLLIEEPESHVHAQRQLRLIKSLEDETKTGSHQIIITTHSPLLSSVVKLENITIMKNQVAFPLSKQETKLKDDDYVFLEKYLDATKANLFFAKAVVIVEGPSEEILLPTIAKVINRDFAEYGVSVVNARGTGLNRFSGIFQRKNEEVLLDIPVACITDRDVMPDCAPQLCINSDYTDKTKWPDKKKRKWRTESDIKDKDKFIKDICGKSDGQSVKTFVANQWTFEYDLAYAGLSEELIGAIVTLNYVEDNRVEKKQEIKKRFDELATTEEKCSYLYSFFYKKIVSKPDVAFELAQLIEKKYSNKPDELKSKLPEYLLSAIMYVTGG